MSDWIQELVSEKRRREHAAIEEARKRELAEKAYDEQIDGFWTTFAGDLCGMVEEFNTLVQPAERIEINTSEPAMFALRNDGEFGGQFVARLHKEERRAEVDLVIARSVTDIDCPIVVNENSQSFELAFRATKGELYDTKAAARMLLTPYLKWTLGLLDTPPADGRKIGFGTW